MPERPLQGKLFYQGSPGDCLGLLHLRVNEFTTVLWDSTVSTNDLFGTLIGVAASYFFYLNLAL